MVGWRILLWAVLVVAAIVFLFLVRGILLPFVVSFIIAALLEPLVRRLRLKGMKRAGAIAVVMVGFYAVLILMGVLLTPSITRQVTNLANRAEDLTNELSQDDANDNFFLRWNPVVQAQQKPSTTLLDRVFSEYGGYLDRFGLPSNKRAFMDQYVEKQKPKIAAAVQTSFNSFFGILTNLFSQLVHVFLIFILVPMFLADMDSIRKRGPTWIPPAIRKSTLAIMGDIGDVFVSYLRGIASVMLLFTVCITIAMLLLGVPYALLIGPIFGALYLIPYLGNVAAAATTLCIVGFSGVNHNMLFGLGNPWVYGLLCMGVYILIAFIFDHLIYPQIAGHSVGLSPVVSIFVVFCGAALFGIVGMLVAFPIAGAAKVILDRLLKVTSKTSDGLRLPAVPLRHR